MFHWALFCYLEKFVKELQIVTGEWVEIASTQMVIYFLYSKIRNLKVSSKRPFGQPSFVLWLRNTEFLKLYPNCNSIFDHEIQNLYYSNDNSFFWLETTKIQLNSFFSKLLIVWKKQRKLSAYLSQNIFEKYEKRNHLFCSSLVFLF